MTSDRTIWLAHRYDPQTLTGAEEHPDLRVRSRSTWRQRPRGGSTSRRRLPAATIVSSTWMPGAAAMPRTASSAEPPVARYTLTPETVRPSWARATAPTLWSSP
ncbi:hypothetical protein ABZX75_19320 [Streptomyces sp. NPDC003038]|uniref:hypothetical protein n=1 Tax=unclassified Streptomyces TaxID=2593676 RepID=UPI00339EF16D